MGENQRGCIRAPESRKSVPSEDWCSVDRPMPMITRGSVTRRMKAERPRPGEALEDHRGELEREDGRVEHDAHGHLEQRRVECQ